MKRAILFVIALFLQGLFICSACAEISLSLGDSGVEVGKIQKALSDKGYTISDEYGEYGISTKNAVFMFQDDNGITPSGVVDDDTYDALLNEPDNIVITDKAEDGYKYVRDMPRPGEIATAKSRLWLLGYDCGDTDGEADEQFTEQILLFQEHSGLKTTGICDADTRNEIERQVNYQSLHPVMRKVDSGEVLLGMINNNGELVLPVKYQTYIFCDGIYVMKDKDDNAEYFYPSGDKLELEFENAGYFSEGFCIVSDGHKYGMINTAGQLSIPCEWKELHYLRYGLAEVSDGFIDAANNHYAVKSPDDKYISSLGEGWYDVCGDRFACIYDDSLEIDYNDRWESMVVCSFSEGLRYVRYSNDDVYFYDVTGNVAFKYDDSISDYFSEGLNRVNKDGLYGYVGPEGNIVLDCQYEKATGFSEGYASARLPGSDRYIIIDHNGNNPFPDIWSEEEIVFENGIARIVQDSHVGFINISGDLFIPCEWETSEIEAAGWKDFMEEGMYIYSNMGPFGFSGDLALVAKRDKLYYIDKSGQIVAQAGPANMISTVPDNTGEKAPFLEVEVYSKYQCQCIAEDYLKDYLKNPSSLQIHSVTSSKEGDEYTFLFDYSAMNSFGGLTRSVYLCVVDCTDGTVVLAYAQ